MQLLMLFICVYIYILYVLTLHNAHGKLNTSYPCQKLQMRFHVFCICSLPFMHFPDNPRISISNAFTVNKYTSEI